MTFGNVAAFIGVEYAVSNVVGVVLAAYLDGGNASYGHPVLAAMLVALQAETLPCFYNDLFHLITRVVLKDVVYAPRAVAHFDVFLFAYFFRNLHEFALKLVGVFVVGYAVDVRRATEDLGSEAVYYFYAVLIEDLGFRDFVSKAVAALGKYHFGNVWSLAYVFENVYERLADRAVGINRENHLVDWLK